MAKVHLKDGLLDGGEREGPAASSSSRQSLSRHEENDDLRLHNDMEWDVALEYLTFQEEDEDSDRAAFEEMDLRRRKVVALMRNANLQMMPYTTSNGKAVFIVVRTTTEVLQKEAERQSFKMPTKASVTSGRSRIGETGMDNHTVVYKPFKTVLAKDFPEFDSLTRQRLIKSILEAPVEEGGCGIDVEDLVEQGVFERIFPLHHQEERSRIKNIWFGRRKWWELYKVMFVPDWELRNYFGEKAGFYFVWLSHYTQWLVPLSLLGVVTTIVQYANGSTHNPMLPVYCILLCLWCDLFLESWKRKTAELRFSWNVRDFEIIEKPRREFTGEPQVGMYTTGGYFVKLDDMVTHADAAMQKYFPVQKRLVRQATGLPLIIAFLGSTVVGTVALLAFKTFEAKQHGDTAGAVVAGVLNAVFITLMNVAYAKVAEALNNYENHRTASQHEDALIIKTFLFQFVNSYISLFYIAFIKEDPSEKNHQSQIFGLDVGVCQTSCMDELFIQLATLVIAKQLMSNVVEVCLPFLKQKLLLYLRRDNSRETKSELRREVLDEATSSPFLGTFYEYNEMCIQYGYVTLFAAAFPLASVSSWVNNLFEIQTDGLKLLYGSQRPWYQGDNDIGTWMYVLQSLSIVAVITNCFIVGFTSYFLRGEEKCDDNDVCTCEGYCLSTSTRLTIVFIAEHIIFFFKVVVPMLIDDTPSWVHREIAKQEIASDMLSRRSVARNPVNVDDEANKATLFEICAPTIDSLRSAV